MGSGYLCPVCKMEVANIGNHIDCPGPNRNSGPFPEQVMGGRGVCRKCGNVVNNLAYHETVCRGVSSSLIEHAELNGNKPLDDYTLDKQVNLRLVFKSDKDRIKELEEENKKLRDALKILNEKLDVVNRRVNRMQDDAYNDIMPDRDDYR